MLCLISVHKIKIPNQIISFLFFIVEVKNVHHVIIFSFWISQSNAKVLFVSLQQIYNTYTIVIFYLYMIAVKFTFVSEWKPATNPVKQYNTALRITMTWISMIGTFVKMLLTILGGMAFNWHRNMNEDPGSWLITGTTCTSIWDAGNMG